MNTKKLIQRCKQNNYKAQLEVYNSYKHLFFNASIRILKRREEEVVDDIWQTINKMKLKYGSGKVKMKLNGGFGEVYLRKK